AGLVAVRGIEAALVVLEAAAQWGARPDHPPLLPPGRPPGPTRRMMGDEARRQLEAAGVPVPRWEVVSVDGAREAADRLGYPVVVKAAGLAHKTEADAVALDLNDAGAVDEVARRIAGASAAEMVIVERQVGDAVVELLVSVRREDPVGWLLTIGAGGTLVEILEDTCSLLLPVTAEDVRSALQGLSVWPLLAGYRGRPGADVEAVVDAVLGVVQMAVAPDRLVEVECNPLIAGAEGATVVDVLVEREDPEGQR
ncbi:MAG: acetate--CoA ligase family protein, partial [Actinomycetota bacterium]|nr:acetate--CoA ligase family protein [Actinomycetota bacterium]